MKFVVKKEFGGTYDVKLHWETRDKLKKVAYYSGLVALASGVYVYVKSKG
jgi:hypothetical protein